MDSLDLRDGSQIAHSILLTDLVSKLQKVIS